VTTLGLALPHYDGFFPDPDTSGPDRTRAAVRYAQRAEAVGLDQVWVSDHQWLQLADGRRRHSPDCWSLLAAIAATTQHIRIGSLVTPVTMRHPLLLTHQIATVLDLAGPRLDVGLGAGWNEAEFTSAGLPFPAAPVRLAAVKHTATLVRNELGDAAPPIWVGGKRSGILRVTGETADGWNLAWDPTPEDYAERRARLQRAIDRSRPNGTLLSSVGLTTVIGIDEPDLQRRWTALRSWVPAGHLDSVPFDTWRSRGLIGTPDEIRTRIARWTRAGVDHIVCALGMPFGVFDDEQIDLLATIARDPRTPAMPTSTRGDTA
jgi:alkanesulfonate monooxygenase SsuD/methylene tetrahydromethanopterin reductase-like flavin-dependent oxidoreductase (luciferase family)